VRPIDQGGRSAVEVEIDLALRHGDDFAARTDSDIDDGCTMSISLAELRWVPLGSMLSGAGLLEEIRRVTGDRLV
jgi:hypothetical protein